MMGEDIPDRVGGTGSKERRQDFARPNPQTTKGDEFIPCVHCPETFATSKAHMIHMVVKHGDKL